MDTTNKPNYISLIEEHWRWSRQDGLSPIAGYLYFYLLHYCNSLFWEKRFTLTNRIICADLNITDKTLIKARRELVEAKRIYFDPGKAKNEASVYEILGCKNSTPNSSANGSANGSANEKRGVKSPHYNSKDKTKEKEERCIYIESERGIPTKEDVVNFVCYELGGTEDYAAYFFDFYNAQGWKKSNGLPIEHWKSQCRWFLNKKKEFEKQYAKNNGKYGNSEEARQRRLDSLREYIARNLASTEVSEWTPQN